MIDLIFINNRLVQVEVIIPFMFIPGIGNFVDVVQK